LYSLATVLDQAPAHDPRDALRYVPALGSAELGRAGHAFLAHIGNLREHGVRSSFSVGVAITEPIRAAITACLDWPPAIDSDRKRRDRAEIAELTHLIGLSAYPDAVRMIVRRERPHPGAHWE
jgi:hypothetical protein